MTSQGVDEISLEKLLPVELFDMKIFNCIKIIRKVISPLKIIPKVFQRLLKVSKQSMSDATSISIKIK